MHNAIFNSVSHENNMNILRYALSIYIILIHVSGLVGYGWNYLPDGHVIIGCFFTMSGFLMYGTYQKDNSLKKYIRKRARRILPPYFFIVLLCAFGLSIISTYSIGDYFKSSEFWRYLLSNLSFLNFIQPNLPGVFDSLTFKISAVNGSLWTMKGEWLCYLSVPLIYSIIHNNIRIGRIVFIIIILLSIFIQFICDYLSVKTNIILYSVLGKQFGTLIVYFYIGAFINLNFTYFLKFKNYILVISLFLLWFNTIVYNPIYAYLIKPFIWSFIIMFLCFTGRWGYKLSHHDNVSYDMYLFHFPIIQVIIYLGVPQIYKPYMVFLIVLFITIIFSALSWNFIGKNFIRIIK